jgi:hypothetical protein
MIRHKGIPPSVRSELQAECASAMHLIDIGAAALQARQMEILPMFESRSMRNDESCPSSTCPLFAQ